MLRSSGSRPNRPSGLADDSGSAALEFLAAGVMLLVPMVYLVTTLSHIETAALATEGAARHAARVIARDGGDDASETAARSVAATAADFGIDPARLETDVRCAPDPADCRLPDSVVTVDISVDVPLPLVPTALDMALPLRVPVSASASARVSDLAPVS